MQHRYECPACGLTSEPYLRRSKAEEKGVEHRQNRHDGMHPKGEGILTDVFQLPGRSELKPALILIALVAAGLISKFL
jgi:hypothetical protein